MKCMYSLIFVPAATVALSSIPSNRSFRPPPSPEASANPGSPRAASDAASPWRVALDIGREPLARMPFDWARSGCRMPLVVPSDLYESNNALVPHSDTVAFTGPDGQVVGPITGDGWELSDDERTITLCYILAKEMKRRDVYLETGTELVLTGRIYTEKEMDRINGEYYQARDALWKAGGEIGDMYDRKEASRKWDDESGEWVERYEAESPFKFAQKQIMYWAAKAQQGRKMDQRPELDDISDKGSFPGVEGGAHIAKEGVVRVGRNGPVCGTWSAVPITLGAASYRGSGS